MADYSNLHGGDTTSQFRLKAAKTNDGKGVQKSNNADKAKRSKKGFHEVIEDQLLESVAHEPMRCFTNFSEAATNCQPIMTVVNLEENSEKMLGDIMSATKMRQNEKRVDFNQFHEEIEEDNTDHAMVLGDVGSGKTVTSKQYALAVSRGEVTTMHKIKLVHRIVASDLQVEEKSNAFDLIFTQQVGSKLTPDLQQEGKEWMANNAAKTLLVVDGLDQTIERFKGNYGKLTVDNKAKSTAVLANVLSGDIYPGLKILSTARWRVYWSLLKKQRPRKVIALRGFTIEAMEKMIRKLCKTQQAEKIINHLKQKAPQLLSLCKNPMFLIYTVQVLSENNSDPPDTVSGIMVALLKIFSRSGHSDADINVLMKLAHHGMLDNRFTFTVPYVEKLGISYDELRGFISVGQVFFQDRADKDDLRFQFSHQSLQELLAAVYLFNLQKDQLNDHLRCVLEKPEMEDVLKLFYGIVFNPQTTKEVEKYLKDRSSDIETCKSILMQQLRSFIVGGVIKDGRVISLIHEAGPDVVAQLQPAVSAIVLTTDVEYIYRPEWSNVLLSVTNKFFQLKRIVLSQLPLNSSTMPLLLEIIHKVEFFQVKHIVVSGEISIEDCGLLGKVLKSALFVTLDGCLLTPDKLRGMKEEISKQRGCTQYLIIANDASMDSSCMSILADIMVEIGTLALRCHECGMNKKKVDALYEKLQRERYKVAVFVFYDRGFKPTFDDISSICRIKSHVALLVRVDGWEISEPRILYLQGRLNAGPYLVSDIYIVPNNGKERILRRRSRKHEPSRGTVDLERLLQFGMEFMERMKGISSSTPVRLSIEPKEQETKKVCITAISGTSTVKRAEDGVEIEQQESAMERDFLPMEEQEALKVSTEMVIDPSVKRDSLEDKAHEDLDAQKFSSKTRVPTVEPEKDGTKVKKHLTSLKASEKGREGAPIADINAIIADSAERNKEEADLKNRRRVIVKDPLSIESNEHDTKKVGTTAISGNSPVERAEDGAQIKQKEGEIERGFLSIQAEEVQEAPGVWTEMVVIDPSVKRSEESTEIKKQRKKLKQDSIRVETHENLDEQKISSETSVSTPAPEKDGTKVEKHSLKTKPQQEQSNVCAETMISVQAVKHDKDNFEMEQQEKETEKNGGESSSELIKAKQEPDASLITADGQVVVSKTTRKEIGPDGGAITVGGCIVTFPEKSLHRKTEIVAKAEINRVKWPKGYFLITPMLYVDGGENLFRPASVRMRSWCVNDGSEENKNTTVDLLHPADKSDEWNPIAKLPFTNKTVYQFECTNFSPYAFGIRELIFGSQPFVVQPYLFSNPRNTLTYTFSLADEMVLEAIKKDMRESGNTFEKFFSTPTVKKNDKITIHTHCVSPNGFTCVPDKTSFKIDVKMAEAHRYTKCFNVRSDNQASTAITLESSIFHNHAAVENNQQFIYDWQDGTVNSGRQEASDANTEKQSTTQGANPSVNAQVKKQKSIASGSATAAGRDYNIINQTESSLNILLISTLIAIISILVYALLQK